MIGHLVRDDGLWGQSLELLAHRGVHRQTGVMGILKALSGEVVALYQGRQRRRKVLRAHVLLHLSLQLHSPVLEPGSNLKKSTNRKFVSQCAASSVSNIDHW